MLSIGTYYCQQSPKDIFAWETTLGCYSNYASPVTQFVTVSSFSSTFRQTQTMNATDAINAYAIQVRFQATDFSKPTVSYDKNLSGT